MATLTPAQLAQMKFSTWDEIPFTEPSPVLADMIKYLNESRDRISADIFSSICDPRQPTAHKRAGATFVSGIPKPICAMCNREVFGMTVTMDHERRAHRVVVTCHGAVEEMSITMDMLRQAGPNGLQQGRAFLGQPLISP